jgi:Putative zinc-finger
MTTCKTTQPRLTAYLDGELTDDAGSVVRGHLRECAACRKIARDESMLRDGLRSLAPVDPPSSLWAGVQARLAAAEVADARTPRWRRLLARWTPSVPRFAAGGMVAAAAVVLLYWRTHRVDDAAISQGEPAGDRAGGRLVVIPVPRTEPHQAGAQPSAGPAVDVTEDLLGEPARTTASHADAIEELMKIARDVRPGWSEARVAAFDARVTALRADVARGQGRAQQRAQRALIRYLQGEVVRDDVVLASGGMQ